MDNKTFQELSKWLGQICAVIAVVILVYVKSKFTFQFGNDAGKLLSVAMVASILGFIFGIVTLPRWQGFVTLAILGVFAYFFLFTPLYATP